MRKIIDTDQSDVIARMIYEEFKVDQSTCVDGFETKVGGRVESRGECVLKCLEQLDERDNTYENGDKRRRKRVKPMNTIGGYVAHKIFKWAKVITDEGPKYTIWRIQ